MSKVNILSGEFDAQIWAREWLKIIEENPSIPTDEGTMLSWFANAIMAGYDHAYQEMEERQSNKIREKLANLCHDQWTGWMAYLFTKGEFNDDDGSWIMPNEFVKRWHRQMSTAYTDLPEKEKDSDRKEADKFLAVMGEED